MELSGLGMVLRTSATLELGKKDKKFNAVLGYRANPRPAWGTGDPGSRKDNSARD